MILRPSLQLAEVDLDAPPEVAPPAIDLARILDPVVREVVRKKIELGIAADPFTLHEIPGPDFDDVFDRRRSS